MHSDEHTGAMQGAAQNVEAAAATDGATSVPAAAAAAAASFIESKRKSRSAPTDAADPSSAAAASSPQSDVEEKEQAASSVLESASASAPVAKRTRLEPAGLLCGLADVAPFGSRRWFEAVCDAHAVGKDLASLVASGRSWSAWIAESPASVGSQAIEIFGDWTNSFERCRWIRRAVQDLVLRGAPQFDQFLRCIPHLSRLSPLRWSCSATTITVHLLRDSLPTAAATLTHLHSLLMGPPRHRYGNVESAVWPVVSLLTGLMSLEMDFCVDEDCCAFLPSMLRLERLRLGRSSTSCSTQLVGLLPQCKALTDLQCGQWLPNTRSGEIARAPPKPVRPSGSTTQGEWSRAIASSVPRRRIAHWPVGLADALAVYGIGGD